VQTDYSTSQERVQSVYEPVSARRCFVGDAPARVPGASCSGATDAPYAVSAATAGLCVYRFDTWDFERTFSRQSPKAASLGASPELRKAFWRGSLHRGMTAELIARLRGFPPGSKTRAKLLAEVKTSLRSPGNTESRRRSDSWSTSSGGRSHRGQKRGGSHDHLRYYLDSLRKTLPAPRTSITTRERLELCPAPQPNGPA
jgi:hypothetical protein